MNVLDRLWERISGSQPLPPAWVVAVVPAESVPDAALFVTNRTRRRHGAPLAGSVTQRPNALG